MNDTATRGRRRRALIVVDVQRDFCPGGALPAPGCNRILPAINRHLAEAHALGMTIYASRDWHPPVTTHFKEYGGEWPPHCVQGSPGAQFHPALELPPTAIIISKGEDPERPGYSAFEGHTPDGRSLLQDLRDRRVEMLYVAGVATDYCVRQTTLEALRAGLQVAVLTDAVAGIDVHPGDVDRALAEMSRAGAEMATAFAAVRSQKPDPTLRPPDIVLLAAEWQPRALIRAQLIEDGFEVIATDTWPTMRRCLRTDIMPWLALVDLQGLTDPANVLKGLHGLMKPERVLIVTAIGTLSADEVERLGFRALSRPIGIGGIVRAAADIIRSAGSRQHAG